MIQVSKADVREDAKRYVARAMTLIHDPKTRQSVLNGLQGDDPVQKVANVAVLIMQRIDSASRAQGIEVKDAVKVWGAHQIVEMVVEFGNEADIFKLDKDLVELALSVTVQDYVKAEVKAQRIDPKALSIALQRDIRTLPPKMRKEIQQSPARLQQIARKYNHGKGMKTEVAK